MCHFFVSLRRYLCKLNLFLNNKKIYEKDETKIKLSCHYKNIHRLCCKRGFSRLLNRLSEYKYRVTLTHCDVFDLNVCLEFSILLSFHII